MKKRKVEVLLRIGHVSHGDPDRLLKEFVKAFEDARGSEWNDFEILLVNGQTLKEAGMERVIRGFSLTGFDCGSSVEHEELAKALQMALLLTERSDG